jgi:endo-1,4-beta-xylanase
MGTKATLTRRSFLVRGGLGAAAVLGGGARVLTRMAPAWAAPTGALFQAAAAKSILYGSSTATWHYEPDSAYATLFQREAGMLFTEDDLL